jgi:hypothetical protein
MDDLELEYSYFTLGLSLIPEGVIAAFECIDIETGDRPEHKNIKNENDRTARRAAFRYRQGHESLKTASSSKAFFIGL